MTNEQMMLTSVGVLGVIIFTIQLFQRKWIKEAYAEMAKLDDDRKLYVSIIRQVRDNLPNLDEEPTAEVWHMKKYLTKFLQEHDKRKN